MAADNQAYQSGQPRGMASSARALGRGPAVIVFGQHLGRHVLQGPRRHQYQLSAHKKPDANRIFAYTLNSESHNEHKDAAIIVK